MLSSNLHVTGYDASSWRRLISLFGAGASSEASPRTASSLLDRLVVVEDDHGACCAAFIADRGPVTLERYAGRGELSELCAQFGVRGAVAMRLGTIDALAERAAEDILHTNDTAGQWLALFKAMRALQQEGDLYFWPETRDTVPLPSTQLLTRALDVVLPDEHSFVAVLWEETEVWTALVLRRSGGKFDLIAGPELVLDTVGPLSGDFRRDHRAVSRAISGAVAPVQVGIYCQRKRFQRLLRDAEPGAWAKAIALLEIIIDPSPAYVHIAVAADALRATARKAGELLGGVDFLTHIEPWTRYAREQVANVASITGMLGFNPLELLAQQLQTYDDAAPSPLQARHAGSHRSHESR
jgi:hypothetical protein